MPIHVRRGGVIRPVGKVYERRGGVIREVSTAHVRRGAVIRQVFSSGPGTIGFVSRNVEISNFYIKENVSAEGGLRFAANGVLQIYGGPEISNSVAIGADEWLAAGDPADWEIRATLTAGTATNSGETLNAWHALGAVARDFGQSVFGPNGTIRTGTFTFDFGLLGTSTPLHTVTDVVLTARIL